MNYKKVKNLLERVPEHVAQSRSLIEKPYVISDYGRIMIFIQQDSAHDERWDGN